jgi:hypothetical protein
MIKASLIGTRQLALSPDPSCPFLSVTILANPLVRPVHFFCFCPFHWALLGVDSYASGLRFFPSNSRSCRLMAASQAEIA